MQHLSIARRTAVVGAACAALGVAATAVSAASAAEDKKASISLKATPSIGFSPARVVVTAEVKDGPNDAAELYCASVEWVWGDDTRSESKTDCDPYEAGRSEIRRRYTLDHTYQTAGNYRIEFYLKQKNKRVLGGRTTVTIRPGVRDIGN
jgi:plastocyanin